MLIKKLFFSLFLFIMLLSFNPLYGVRYSGNRHTTSHGGHYSSGRGSSHKGGHYKNAKTFNHYEKHKR